MAYSSARHVVAPAFTEGTSRCWVLPRCPELSLLAPRACRGRISKSNRQAREGWRGQACRPSPGSVLGCAQARSPWAPASLEACSRDRAGPFCRVPEDQTGWQGRFRLVVEGASDSHRRVWCLPGPGPPRQLRVGQ